MGFAATTIGKYQLGKTIGEGTFAKVKLALDTVTRQHVAVKIIDKQMVMENKLMEQVKREISTMKLLHHPSIVRIYEVTATKTKIYIIMEYVPGGQLSDKLSYIQKFDEREARKYFQQLIDAVDYCHSRGVYHRDLKPENLLLDGKGNLKVSDFGLSALRKPGDLLSTACGSPCYVAPEVIAYKKYDGASADIWSCGVILFELLAGRLPFDDRNLMNLYRKISRTEYTCPEWFTASQRKLLFRILEPMPKRRMTVAEILQDEWFQTSYEPSGGIEYEISLANVAAFDGIGRKNQRGMPKSSSFINAFQLIAMSSDLDLSGLFENQDEDKQRTRFGSKHPINETIEKIEVAAKDVSLSVERMNISKQFFEFQVKIHQKQKLMSCPRSYFNLSAEVIEVTPTHCVIQISKSAGELRVYNEFCKSLSNLLIENSSERSESNMPSATIIDDRKQSECSSEWEENKKDEEPCGYNTS
ncbi:CBL-interacting serine/threonine-protein kinase 21-like isoform X2 [Telopea speciosissima]|uniref:CBL-interacting serine/threonine-protein kinase 21-like isoform X2 n=1 Tax=Telopea speciosissima TaxID=54955 RepID=UPI001CC533BF|nr:CBL-interacting serine/threonine-protein kinase 21-like isoform X2 [Telopea speciosissima]